MALTAAERETTMTIDDEAKTWVVSSFRRADITRLKKNPDFVITEEGNHDGSPFVFGTLPMGGIAIRAKSAGTIKRTVTTKTKRKGMPANAARCSSLKADGTPCKSLASKVTGKCAKHS